MESDEFTFWVARKDPDEMYLAALVMRMYRENPTQFTPNLAKAIEAFRLFFNTRWQQDEARTYVTVQPQIALDSEFMETFNALMGSGDLVAAFATGLKQADPKIRSTMATNLGYTGDARAVEFLIEALKDDDNDVRWSAAKSLNMLGYSRAVPSLIAALKDEDRYVRRAAAQALKSIGGPEAEKALQQMQEEGS